MTRTLGLFLLLCGVLLSTQSFGQFILKKRQHASGYQLDVVKKKKEKTRRSGWNRDVVYTNSDTAAAPADTSAIEEPKVIHQTASSPTLEMAPPTSPNPESPASLEEQPGVKGKPKPEKRPFGNPDRKGAGFLMNKKVQKDSTPPPPRTEGDGTIAAIMGLVLLLAALIATIIAITTTASVATAIIPLTLLAIIFSLFGLKSSKAKLAKSVLILTLISFFLGLIIVLSLNAAGYGIDFGGAAGGGGGSI